MIAGSRKVRSHWRAGLRASLTLAALLGGLGHARAQQDDSYELEPVSRAVVQALPSQQGYQLNAALTRLAANPRDVSALLDAGSAALALGDTDAALGFYGRADQLSPNDPRIKTALASALVRNEDPFAAIPLFDAAERAGARDGALAGDRGLAYDLVGDNLSAQRYYRQALAAAPNDEIVRRLALSQAIAGDRKGSEATLLTQLRRNDPGAWRTRAFILAILGDTEEAVKIANGTMPRDLAGAMIPYLRYMGRLTPAQQAAAASFGHFPRAAQIGRDDPRVARYAALNPRRAPIPAAVVAVKADASGKKGNQDDRLGRRRDRTKQDRNRERDQAAPSLAQAGPVQQQRTTAPVLPPPVPTPRTIAPVRVAAATPAPAVTPRPAESRPVVSLSPPSVTPSAPSAGLASASLGARSMVGSPAAAPSSITLSPSAPAPAPDPVVASSNLDLARRAQVTASEPAAIPAASPAPAQVPAPAATGAPAPEPRRDLSALFSDFRPPEEEQRAAITVDISKLPARAKKAAPADERGPIPDAPTGTKRIVAADPATSTGVKKGAAAAKAGKAPAKVTKPAVPSHPSRIWVQIGVGRDKGALGFDWRKLGKADADMFKGRKAWTTPWGQTNRLLVGPFETQAAAQAFLKDVRKKAADAFLWTSPAGQAVDALGGK
ncbi:MAG: SPOR domain-containing protein [Novosphingobium sp.]|nr:SPOR domain-containing protein [Novosphingobium sp.]